MNHKAYSRLLALLMSLAVSLSCKPVGQDSETKGFKKTVQKAFPIYGVKLETAILKIKNRGLINYKPDLEPADEEKVKLGDDKVIWSLAAYLSDIKGDPQTTIAVTKDAGTVAPPSADTGAAPTKANFFTSHFALDSTGLHMSSSKDIRNILLAKAKDIDLKQVADAKKEEAKKKNFWDDTWIGGFDDNFLSAAERKQLVNKKLAFEKARNEALKLGTGLWSPAEGKKSSFSFSAALKKFKETEKLRFSTNIDVKHAGASVTASAWLSGKVLARPMKAKIVEIVMSAALNDPKDKKINLDAALRVLFLGTDMAGTIKKLSGTAVNKSFTIPTVAKASIPLYGFPAGGIVVEIELAPAVTLGADVDVDEGGKLTLTFIPGISLVLSVSVGAEAAVVFLGVEGSTTVLAMEVPLSISLGGDIKGGAYYAGVNYIGIVISALGGTGVALVAKVEVPSPFNYVLWGINAALKLSGFKLPGEVGIEGKYKAAYPIWEPEYKLNIFTPKKYGGPSYLKAPAKPSAAQCTLLKTNIAAHLAAAKKEKDTVKDEELTEVDKGAEVMLTELQTKIKTICK